MQGTSSITIYTYNTVIDVVYTIHYCSFWSYGRG
uniref:Uncharacterized protein n=1 Tax=Siphoviridae sp. ctqwY3 TaxID=2827951 RepID=A0A8S5S749_9CAUD|nr:MAG TPA: hypothetical protein [Siphoviridae sp. ctqwY3]